MEQLNEFMKNNEIVWAGSSYLSGHHTYGPFGTLMKNKIQNTLRRILEEEEFDEVETPLILSRETVKHSGHLDNFTDPIIYTQSGKQTRLDQLVEEHSAKDTKKSFHQHTREEVIAILEKHQTTFDPPDPFIIPEEWKTKNLMFSANSHYLRPETATSTYSAFNNLLQITNNNLFPIKVFQVGKAFRDEINPKHGIIRCKEFTQLEAQIIFTDEDWVDWDTYKDTKVTYFNDFGEVPERDLREATLDQLQRFGRLENKCMGYYIYLIYSWLEKYFPGRILLVKHSDSEKAFYAKEAWDIEINLNDLGWTEVAGIHHRGTYDLTQQKQYTNLHCKEVPNILELAIGIDRILYAFVDTYYHKPQKNEGKIILQLPFSICPIQIAILPLVKNKESITKCAKEIYQDLKNRFNIRYYTKKSIGKRYMYCAMKAIPWCVTVDYQTLEDGTVTIRNRDTEEQFRHPKEDLSVWFGNNL